MAFDGQIDFAYMDCTGWGDFLSLSETKALSVPLARFAID